MATMFPLRPGVCQLSFRQQPHEALVTLQGKEKVRKPVDPPPILELCVNGDPHHHFLQNPYLFVCATLYKHDKDEPCEMSTEKSLAGTLVSSLHRLKDVSNKDGGFFVFGDISIKTQGTFRLCFTLYEFQQDSQQVQHLASAISDKFKVLPAKDFKGLEESTYLSRAFSDQGVRLRLRKEPRSTLHKRSYPFDPAPVSNAPLRPNPEYTDQPAKRSRQDYPAVSRQNYPAVSRQEHPAVNRQDYPDVSRQDYPDVSRQEYPVANQPGYPVANLPGYPATNQPGYPVATREDYTVALNSTTPMGHVPFSAVQSSYGPNMGWPWPGFQYNAPGGPL